MSSRERFWIIITDFGYSRVYTFMLYENHDFPDKLIKLGVFSF